MQLRIYADIANGTEVLGGVVGYFLLHAWPADSLKILGDLVEHLKAKLIALEEHLFQAQTRASACELACSGQLILATSL